MLRMGIDEFGDEDTEPGDELRELTLPHDSPSYELMWVEEPGMGMVLRVRRIVDPN